MPTPRPGSVLGLVGTNGIGKSTALKILAGKLKPNLGSFKVIYDINEIFNIIHVKALRYFSYYIDSLDLIVFTMIQVYLVNENFACTCRNHQIGKKFYYIFEDQNCKIILLKF